MADKSKNKAQGQQGENAACDFLENQGLRLLQKNFSCPCGEIDLIMQDKDSVVFVEVRLRQHSYLGTAIESITPAKQKKVIKTALLYLQKKRWLNKVNCRFDVLGIDSNNQMEWIRNAFGVDY